MIAEDVQSSIEMIRDSARGIVPHADRSRVRDLRFSDPGFDRNVWTQMCAMGWPALRLPEDRGGVGLGVLAYCALVEELGRGLLPEPLVHAALSSALLEGDALEAHLSGAHLVLPAWQDSRDALGPQERLDLTAGRITATKRHVPMATGADAFLVMGTDGAALVSADAPGVAINSARTQDGGTMATVVFENAEATPIDVDPSPALAEAALATSAFLVGLMDAALELTVDYLKTRVQFGRTIGSFQILQHMAVDLKLETQVARASIEDSALRWDRHGPTAETHAAVSRTKARTSQAALKLTRDAIQLHGGIGFTDEHDIGLFLRKAIVVAAQFGSAEAHRANFARLKPLEKES